MVERRQQLRREEDRVIREAITRRDSARRNGDERDWVRSNPLTFLPALHQPFRWLPRHGQPLCVGEWLAQATYGRRKALYAVLVAVLVITLMLFGVPMAGGV